jgi:hypothetical protein
MTAVGGVCGSPAGSWLDLILLKDTAITHGGLDVLGFRGYVVCGGDVVATRAYLPQIDLGGTIRVT